MPAVASGAQKKYPFNIKVCCRIRPLNAEERQKEVNSVPAFEASKDSTNVLDVEKSSGFNFDHVFSKSAKQEDVFAYVSVPLLDDVLDGFNGTIFAYGPTGSGKTYTIMGKALDSNEFELDGLIPRSVDSLFDKMKSFKTPAEFSVKVSFVEIYLEKIRDLLNPANDNLALGEDKAKGVFVRDLSEVYVVSAKEALRLLRIGNQARAVGSTKLNIVSSRSHTIFTLNVTRKDLKSNQVMTGRLHIVDLAGSEKVSKSGATGQTLEEAKKINKSLSCLGNVINALTDSKPSFVPYRDSKLTRILQESLGGNSKTFLILAISGAKEFYSESLSTLRFGERAKSVTNKVEVNIEESIDELKRLLQKTREELERFKRQESSSLGSSWTIDASDGEFLHDRSQSFEIESLALIEAKDQIAHLTATVETLEEEIQTNRHKTEKYQLDNEKLSHQLKNQHIKLEKALFTIKEIRITNQQQKDEITRLSDEITQFSTAQRNKRHSFETSSRKSDFLERLEMIEQEICQFEDKEYCRINVSPEDIRFAQEFMEKSSAGFLKRHNSKKSINSADLNGVPSEEASASARSSNSSSISDRPPADISNEDLDRLQRAMLFQAYEFDKMKKILMQDLQDRCEKVIRLEIQLDELQNVQSAASQNSDATIQAQKIGIIERNMKNLLHKQADIHQKNASLQEAVDFMQKKLDTKDEHIEALEKIVDELTDRMEDEKREHEIEVKFLKLKLAVDEKSKFYRPVKSGTQSHPIDDYLEERVPHGAHQ